MWKIVGCAVEFVLCGIVWVCGIEWAIKNRKCYLEESVLCGIEWSRWKGFVCVEECRLCGIVWDMWKIVCYVEYSGLCGIGLLCGIDFSIRIWWIYGRVCAVWNRVGYMKEIVLCGIEWAIWKRVCCVE